MNRNSNLHRLISGTQSACVLTSQATAPFIVGDVQPGQYEGRLRILDGEAHRLLALATELREEIDKHLDLAREKDQQAGRLRVVA